MDLTADMTVEELVERYPLAAGFLADRGIVCIKCGEPYWGTLRELAAQKGLLGQIDAIVDDLVTYLDAAAIGNR